MEHVISEQVVTTSKLKFLFDTSKISLLVYIDTCHENGSRIWIRSKSWGVKNERWRMRIQDEEVDD